MKTMKRENIIFLPGLENRRHIFRDRQHAGEILAGMFKADVDENAIVAAIPAGGVPGALAVCEKLCLPFDIAVVSKITLPWNTEAGLPESG